MSNGDIYICSDNCCLEFYAKLPMFNDIAYVNDKIYAVDANLNVIDFNSKQLISSFPIYNINGDQIFSDGLEIVNDSLLFLDDETDLYCFNLNTNSIQFVGNTGYYCSGDLLFLNNKLFMTTDSNQLIEIELSSFYAIVNVTVVDNLSIGSVFGLSKINDASELLLFSGLSLYKANAISKECSKVCNLTSSVNGASYYGEKGICTDYPNIITPNNDGVNDLWEFSLASKAQLEIINRWGNLIYKVEGNMLSWDGADCPDGIYFYRITTKENIESGYIQLIR